VKYQPGQVPERDLRAWLMDELRRISNAIGPSEYLQLSPIDEEPERPSKGMVVWAVGVAWNPGAGEGLYVYNEAGTWDKVN
jgi:hypothetical protein